MVLNKKYLGRQYLMTKAEKNVGYIDIRFVKSTNSDVVGGLPLPRLSFRPDHIQNSNKDFLHRKVVESPKEKGAEHKNKKSLFCCHDDSFK